MDLYHLLSERKTREIIVPTSFGKNITVPIKDINGDDIQDLSEWVWYSPEKIWIGLKHSFNFPKGFPVSWSTHIPCTLSIEEFENKVKKIPPDWDHGFSSRFELLEIE